MPPKGSRSPRKKKGSVDSLGDGVANAATTTEAPTTMEPPAVKVDTTANAVDAAAVDVAAPIPVPHVHIATQAPVEAVSRHVIAHCMIGREEPNFVNRAFMIPTCYVPQGSDSTEEVAARHRGEVATLDVAADPSAAPAVPEAPLPVPPPAVRRAYTREVGIQYDTETAFACPFMVHQRLPLDGFVLRETEQGGRPAGVLREAWRQAEALAVEKSLSVTSVRPESIQYALEQQLMRARVRPALEAPPPMDEYLFVDCEARLGCLSVFPDDFGPVPPADLSLEQRDYVSRFQLLTQDSIQPQQPSDDSAVPVSPPSSVEKVHVARSLTVGVFDPFFSAASHEAIAGALRKMAKSKLNRGAEATQVAPSFPVFQLIFQARAEGGGVLVLETHDCGKTWYELVSEKGLGSIDAPIVNSKKFAVQAAFVARHIRLCNPLQCEWASYYLSKTFSSDPKKGVDTPAKSARATDEVPNIGFVHPISTSFAGDYEALRRKWQLVSVERIVLHMSQMSESSKFLPNLAKSAETDGMMSDAAACTPDKLSQVVRGQSPESALILTSHTHTKTFYIDDGAGFLRGATVFRRRFSLSNEHMLHERSHLWGIDKIALGNRFCSAIHSLLNETTAALTHRLVDCAVIPGRSTAKSLADAVPVYIFPQPNCAEGGNTPLIATTVDTAKHGQFLQGLVQTVDPIVDLAKSFALNAHVPWNVVRYPLCLNNFSQATLPLMMDRATEDASRNAVPAVIPKATIREGGKVCVFQGSDGSERTLSAQAPLMFSEGLAALLSDAAAVERHGALLSSSFQPSDKEFASKAPVFAVSFGHQRSESFACESLLTEVLHRMLGQSLKTTVSVLCFSDYPSRAMKSLPPETAAQYNATMSPLGTRAITSVFLDSRDASRSHVADLARTYRTPSQQEAAVRLLLQRIMAPSALRNAEVRVQTLTDASGITHAMDPAQADSFYRLDALPEEVIDVFRVVHASESIANANGTTTLAADMYGIDTAEYDADAADPAQAFKDLVRTAVSVSQVILENAKATSIVRLLEGMVRGDPTFSYLPQVLEAEKLRADGSGLGEGGLRGSAAGRKMARLVTRPLSRVVLAEDKYYLSEGVEASARRTDPLPATYVVHRTVHDVCVGPDGIARYEKTSFLFFSERDPSVIIGAKGRAQEVESAMRAHMQSSRAVKAPNSGTDAKVPLFSDVVHLLQNLGRWGLDAAFKPEFSRDTQELEAHTASGKSVHQVLQGWLQSTLSQRSADILAMVQGDEKMARNPLVHVLVDAASKCSAKVTTMCRSELLHWTAGLAETAGILTPRDLEHAFLHNDFKRVLRKSGIPAELLPHMFHPRPESDENSDPFLRPLPCDTHCRITSQLYLDMLPGWVVPVAIPRTIHTSDGMPLAEGSVALVGHASPQMVERCNQYFGDMAPIHQLGELLVIPATQDVDVALAVETSEASDLAWRSSLETQFARLKTLEGQPTFMKRNKFNQFVAPTVFERSLIENSGKYVVPAVGMPLYKRGKLVSFWKGNGAHDFVSSVLNSGNLRKLISFIPK